MRVEANESVARPSSPLPLTYVQGYALAIFSVGITDGLSVLLEHFHFRAPSVPFLFAIALSSWYGGPGPGTLAVLLSTLSFEYYFAPPLHSFRVSWSAIPYFVTFTIFAVLMCWFGAIRRRVEAGLRERAALLNLTHDTVFVMDMAGVIKYWNRGAEERYGWSAEQAAGPRHPVPPHLQHDVMAARPAASHCRLPAQPAALQDMRAGADDQARLIGGLYLVCLRVWPKLRLRSGIFHVSIPNKTLTTFQARHRRREKSREKSKVNLRRELEIPELGNTRPPGAAATARLPQWIKRLAATDAGFDSVTLIPRGTAVRG